jgi:HSP20 family protein
MAKQKRRRRNAEPKRIEKREQPQASSKSREEQSAGRRQPERAITAATEAAAANPFESMERLMQVFMPMAWLRPWMMEVQTPKLDVIDRNGAVLVRAEVPGVDKEHLAVEASDVAVTIRGEVQREGMREDGNRRRVFETSHGSFERTVRLPADVDGARAKATFKDGVLEVLLPKVDRSRSHPVKL